MHSTNAMSSAIAFCANVVVCAVVSFTVLLLLSIPPGRSFRAQVCANARAVAEDRQRTAAACARQNSLRRLSLLRGRACGMTPLALARFLAGVLAGRRRCWRGRVTVAAPCGNCTRLPLFRTSSSCMRQYSARAGAAKRVRQMRKERKDSRDRRASSLFADACCVRLSLGVRRFCRVAAFVLKCL